MARIVLEGKLLKWGNSYGVRIAKADVEQAHLQLGAPMTVTPGEPGKIDLSHIRTFRSGDRFGSRDHDEILYMAQLEKMLHRGSIRREEYEREMAKTRRIIARRGNRVDR